ncbi:MAG: hypothetical protein IIA89_14920 [Chloroflexi bacterium]|nr:hypothetical protein [Chloroflexota bacterium]
MLRQKQEEIEIRVPGMGCEDTIPGRSLGLAWRLRQDSLAAAGRQLAAVMQLTVGGVSVEEGVWP